MQGQDFTLTSYKALIGELLAQGYVCRRFEDVAPDKQHLVLRHDVDFSTGYAVRLAEAEAEQGVFSYYYVLLRSAFYNCMAPQVLADLKRLIALGHHVGLHFDAALYAGGRDVLEEAALKECSRLEELLGSEVGSISFHRPAAEMVGLAGRFARRLHSYDPRFVNDIGYCSDSRGEWRFGHPLDHAAVKAKRALQLLTHPIWWHREEAEPPVSRVQRFLQEQAQSLSGEAAINCIPYRDWLSVSLKR